MSIAGGGNSEEVLSLEAEKLNEQVDGESKEHNEKIDRLKALSEFILKNYLKETEETIEDAIDNFVRIGSQLRAYSLETNDPNSITNTVISITKSLTQSLENQLGSEQFSKKYPQLKKFCSSLNNGTTYDSGTHFISNHSFTLIVEVVNLENDDGEITAKSNDPILVKIDKSIAESKCLAGPSSPEESNLLTPCNFSKEIANLQQTLKLPPPSKRTYEQVIIVSTFDNGAFGVRKLMTTSGRLLNPAESEAIQKVFEHADTKRFAIVGASLKQNALNAGSFKPLLAPRAANDQNLVTSISNDTRIQLRY